MMYNLSNSQSDRINYDGANSNYFDDQIEQYVAAGGELVNLDRNVFNAWFDIDQESVDDREEAEARAWSTFQERVIYAKRQAFTAVLENSEFGMAVRYGAGAYTAYVSEDDEHGGYFISYCKGEMPPHETAHAETAEQAARKLAEIADLATAFSIEPDYE
jgi:hypothetical protein